MPNVMTSYAYQRQRSAYLTHHATLDTPCGICHRPIRYDLPGNHPTGLGPAIDHIIERVRGLVDDLDETNWRPAHNRCNTLRGASLGGRRLAAKKRAQASRQW